MISSPEWEVSVGLEIGGLTTVSPFKESACRAIGNIRHPRVAITGAGNLAVYDKGIWWADTTDGAGVAAIVKERMLNLTGKSAAVVGCGGAGRSIAQVLKEQGCQVSLFNRSLPRGETASAMLNLPFYPLVSLQPGQFDVIVHATPQGKKANELPFDPGLCRPGTLIIDLTYAKGETPLIAKAIQSQLLTGSGKEILVRQVRLQYKGMTGLEMPLELAQELAGIDNKEAIDN